MANRIKESGAQIKVNHNSKSLIQKALAALLAAGMVLSIISMNLLTPSPAVAQDGTILTRTESCLIEMAARERGLRPSDLEVLASRRKSLRSFARRKLKRQPRPDGRGAGGGGILLLLRQQL